MARPLVVDLDGTLLQSDMLVESAFAFLRQHPTRALSMPLFLFGGKAHLKGQLAASAKLDVTTLPYDLRVLDFLRQQRSAGRTIVLATATHEHYARAIAEHLGLFDCVLATDGKTNMSAAVKAQALVSEYGQQGFDYMGNSSDDLVVWKAANRAYVVNPESGVEAAATRLGNVELTLPVQGRDWRDWAKQLRVHQWMKNALLLVPLLASHRVAEMGLLLAALQAFLVFSMCASSVYLLNDLLDLHDDRRHPTKRFRPLARGTVSVKAALLVCPGLMLAAIGGSVLFLPWKFTLALGLYYALTLAYSVWFKRVMTVDVIVLAMLYTTRIIAGTLAFDIPLTFWMLAFSMFLFLSLALVKRYAELRELQSRGEQGIAGGRGYSPADLGMIASLGAASGYLAVMVLALYIQDQHTVLHYRRPQVIWLACPLLLYWITRAWMVAHRGWMHDDPVVFAVKDRNSILTGVLFALVFLLAV